MTKCLEEIKKVILIKKGKFELKEKPRIIGEKHEREMAQMIKELEIKNDDEDDDDEEVEGMGQSTAIDKELDKLTEAKQKQGGDDDEDED